jgi:hypothetical protein
MYYVYYTIYHVWSKLLNKITNTNPSKVAMYDGLVFVDKMYGLGIYIVRKWITCNQVVIAGES